MNENRICVVAKRGKKYRFLGVVRHPFLHGKVTLLKCAELLRIFRDPVNRIALEQELVYSAIESKTTDDNGQGKRQGKHEGIHQPFPFIATCMYLCMIRERELILGDLGDRVHLEAADYEERDSYASLYYVIEGVNTVIDITDLDRPEIGFVFLHIGNLTPVSASDYLSKYYHNIDENSQARQLEGQYLADVLLCCKLISPEALEDLWPRKGGHQMMDDELIPLQSESPANVPFKSLLEISMAKFLDELLESGNDADASLLDQPLQTLSMRDALVTYCRRNAARLSRSSCSVISIRILATLWKEETFVDFSPYHEMMPEVVRSILRSLKHVRVLNLSGTLAASKDELSKTLSEINHDLDELYILDRPDRETIDDPLPDIRAIGEQSFTVGRIVLTSVLSKSIKQISWMVSDKHVLRNTIRGFPPSSSTAELYGLAKSFPVIQLIQWLQHDGKPELFRSFYLGDGLLSPVRTVSGLLEVIRQMFLTGRRDIYGSLIAYSFAKAGSSLKKRDATEINTLPAETHCLGKHSTEGGVFPGILHGHVRDLTPDTWTILLQDIPPDECEVALLKVAFLRSKRPIRAIQDQKISLEDLEVVDLETFVAKTAPGHEADLKAALEELKTDAKRWRSEDDQDEESFSPLGADEALRIMEHTFSMIDHDETTRQDAYDWLS